MGIWPYWDGPDARDYFCPACKDEPPEECSCDDPQGCRHCTGWHCQTCGSIAAGMTEEQYQRALQAPVGLPSLPVTGRVGKLKEELPF